jgi:hypothetical protein
MARRRPGTPAHLGSLLGNRRIRATDRFRDARAQTFTDSNVLAFLLLEPVKKLQSAALLLDFWLGQGVRAVAIPAAVLPMLCIALRAAFGRLSPFARLSRPSNGRPIQKDTQPCG